MTKYSMLNFLNKQQKKMEAFLCFHVKIIYVKVLSHPKPQIIARIPQPISKYCTFQSNFFQSFFIRIILNY